MKRRRSRPLRGVKLTKPDLAPYGLRDGAEERVSCPVPAGARRRVNVCQTTKAPGKQMTWHGDVCEYVRGAGIADRESLYAIDLNTKNRVVALEEVAKGTLDEVRTSVREFMKGRILNNAAAFMMVHNHPSGSTEPSEADYELTRHFAKIGSDLGIPLRDHVIVAGEAGCWSIRNDPRARGVQFGGARRKKKRRR